MVRPLSAEAFERSRSDFEAGRGPLSTVRSSVFSIYCTYSSTRVGMPTFGSKLASGGDQTGYRLQNMWAELGGDGADDASRSRL